ETTVHQEILDGVALFERSICSRCARGQSFCSEQREFVEQPFWSTGQGCTVWRSMKISADDAYDFAGVVSVRGRIVACKVGQILGQNKLLAHHDQRALFALRLGAEVLCTKDEAELKRHVEPRQIVDVQLDAREIMYRVAA